jgi:hypothetical protein
MFIRATLLAICTLYIGQVSAQTSDAPPLILDTAKPVARPAVTAPAAEAPAPPSLEQYLQPDLKPLPKDPAARAAENTRRLLAARAEREKLAVRQPEQQGVVVVFGQAPAPEPTIAEKISKALEQPEGEITSTAIPGGTGRIECVRQCVGPMCCVTVETVPPTWKHGLTH